MPKICYVSKKFGGEKQGMINKANEIISVYAEQGYDLTLRQLYYQFVARDLLPNTIKSYAKLGVVVNEARLAGLIDWDHITDRTRNLHKLAEWGSPSDIIYACSQQFKIDLWATQEYRIEVWIEKEALAGVFERVCDELRIPFFSCRGYTSQSEMWAAGRRLANVIKNEGKTPIILHFGDHDPSGIDMTRDIDDRLQMFMGGLEVKRLALNMDQVDTYNPPPNPAKTTDSRYASYIKVYGDESWELDALEPELLSNLVRDAVSSFRNQESWDEAVAQEEEHRRLLSEVSEQWEELTSNL